MDFFSALGIAALAEVSLTQIAGTVAGGIVGNRADAMFCKLMNTVSARFVENLPLPENSELQKGLLNAYQLSIIYIAETISGQARDIRERTLADSITQVAKHKFSADKINSSTLIPLLTPLLAGPGDDQAGLRRDRIITAARDALIAWFEKETGEILPEHFRSLFIEVAPDGRASWANAFRLYLAEVIKTNPQFETIFLASNVSEIVGRTITIEMVIIELEKGLEFLREQLFIVSTDVKHVLVVQNAQDQKINSLVSGVDKLLAAQARQAKVELRAFVLLARKINLEVDDEAQALKELNRAVEELLKVKVAAEDGTHLDVLVDRTLRRIAEQSLRGEFDLAAEEAQNAFDDWKQREAARRNMELHSGLALIEANLRQNLLRRDSVAVATWIERRITLENNGEPVNTTALMEELKLWYLRGLNLGLNLDLSVAIALSRRAVELSPANEAGTAENWLGMSLMSLGERESDSKLQYEAVNVYRESLKERTRYPLPFEWAIARKNLGTALSQLGRRERKNELLEEAIDVFHEALKELDRDQIPVEWAATQCNLGAALACLAELDEKHGIELSGEAVFAFQNALKEQQPEQKGFVWELTQINLGAAQLRLGEYQSSAEQLKDAVKTLQAALKGQTRQHVPLQWATGKYNLGRALTLLDKYEPSISRLNEAVNIFQEVLDEYARERVPLLWGLAKENLGETLLLLGKREVGTKRLNQAINAFREALTERTRERVPLNWASIQANLGIALLTFYQKEPHVELLHQALDAFKEALKEYTPERTPRNWRATQNNFNMALTYLSKK